MLKIIHISDTHAHLYEIQEFGDLLIHSGDITGNGSFDQFKKSMEHLSTYKDKFKKIIVIPGNHDWCCESHFDTCRSLCEDLGIVLLHNSGIEFEGYKIWGSASTPYFFGWAFNFHRGLDIQQEWMKIPLDTNILITHGPIYKILDKLENGSHVGCEDLKNRIKDLKYLKLHCCGHIHPSHGIKKLKKIIYSNGAILNDRYKLANNENIICIE